MNKPSFSQIVAGLDVGETASRVKQIPRAVKIEALQETLNSMKLKLRNAVAPAIAGAQEKHDKASYSVEAGEFISNASKGYVIVVITRLT